VFQTGRQLTETRKRCGISGYISDGNKNSEVLLKTADNGEHTENSIKFSWTDSYVKM